MARKQFSSLSQVRSEYLPKQTVSDALDQLEDNPEAVGELLAQNLVEDEDVGSGSAEPKGKSKKRNAKAHKKS